MGLIREPLDIDASLGVKGLFGAVGARVIVAPCRVAGPVVGSVFGFGSDLSEEPAVQDLRPVTLESESFLSCPPGPTMLLSRSVLGRR